MEYIISWGPIQYQHILSGKLHQSCDAIHGVTACMKKEKSFFSINNQYDIM